MLMLVLRSVWLKVVYSTLSSYLWLANVSSKRSAKGICLISSSVQVETRSRFCWTLFTRRRGQVATTKRKWPLKSWTGYNIYWSETWITWSIEKLRLHNLVDILSDEPAPWMKPLSNELKCARETKKESSLNWTDRQTHYHSSCRI